MENGAIKSLTIECSNTSINFDKHKDLREITPDEWTSY